MTLPVPESQQQYGSVLTVLGENAEQNGKLLNKQLEITHMAIGDANDQYVQPDRKQTALVNELARIEVNSVDVLQPTPDSVPMLKVEAILPDEVNDIVIREFAAVATFNGQIYFHAIGNCARIYVPPPVNNGNVRTPVTLEMIFVITSAEPIVEIDPHVVTASREYVHKQINHSDERLAQTVVDQNGKDWFIDDGFLVTPQSGSFKIQAGAGYVSGNRVSMDYDSSIQVLEKPAFIYIDAWREGIPTGEWDTKSNFIVSADELDDYLDEVTTPATPHFVCKIAQVMADGSVRDLRPEGESATKDYVGEIAGKQQSGTLGLSVYPEWAEEAAKVGDNLIHSYQALRNTNGMVFKLSRSALGIISALNFSSGIAIIGDKEYRMSPAASRTEFVNADMMAGDTDDKKLAAAVNYATITGIRAIYLPRIFYPTKKVVTQDGIRWFGNKRSDGLQKSDGTIEIGWQGAGGILANHGDDCIFEVSSTAKYASAGDNFETMTISNASETPNQHAILCKNNSRRTTFRDVTFEKITGYCQAFDVDGAAYMQNASWENVAMYCCGGCYGLTDEPEDGQQLLSCTLLSLTNVNFDNTVNPISPQKYMWDFRSTREVNASTFLTEGADASSLHGIIGCATNAWITINGWHNEWAIADAPRSVIFEGDNKGKFYADTRQLFTVTDGSGISVKFMSGSKAHAILDRLNAYHAASLDDIVEYDTAIPTGAVTIRDLVSKNPITVPNNRQGWITIESNIFADQAAAPSVRDEKQLFEWYASAGQLKNIDSYWMTSSVDPTTVGSDTIETPHKNNRFIGVTGKSPSVNFELTFPGDYVNSLAVICVRYKYDEDGSDFQVLYSNDTDPKDATLINHKIKGLEATAVCMFRITKQNMRFFSRHINSAPTSGSTLRVYGVSLFMGTRYSEPFGMPK